MGDEKFTPKFKLRLTAYVRTSTRKSMNIARTFVWDNKEDAISCKKLLDKAKTTFHHVEFVEFTEEQKF